jgi:tetratricopeptide (TPR) repeat protein
MTQRLRVFVSSPGDVVKERLRAGLIVDKLAQDYSRFFNIEGYLWEHEPMLSSAHFQDAIEPPSAFDIVVLILWSRLGTPLPESTLLREYRGIDGRTPVTGTEWEYEDALRAALANGVPDLMVFRNIANAPIDPRNPEARAASIAQMAALDTFWKLHFADGGSFRYAFDEYTSLEQFSKRLEEALVKVIERRIKAFTADDNRSEQLWMGEPFRGLESYEFEHAAIFFGRDALIAKATEQLATNALGGSAFLLVSGASGSGKSSLVKGGVVPRLVKPQRISGTAFPRRVVFRAGSVGPDPFLGLARTLIRDSRQEGVGLPELIEEGQDEAALATYLRSAAKDPSYVLGNTLGRLTRAGRENGRLLSYEVAKLILVVDQLEELFTVTDITSETRRNFIILLSGLARSGHVWVIATLRADFWHRAMEIPELLALAEGQGRIEVAAPSPSELVDIIRKPAMAAGAIFETDPRTNLGLDTVLANDAASDPGVLPLLSFTLDELCRSAKECGSPILTHASYAALGGLAGAITKRAEEVVTSLPLAGAALPRLLRAVTTVSLANQLVPVSRAVPLTAFADGSPARQLVDSMIEARLLVADDSGARPTVRLAHEALISRWRLATDNLARDRRDLETRNLVEEQYKRWSHENSASRRLLRNPDLANAVDLAKRWGDELAVPVRDYIKRSEKRARAMQTLTGAAAVVFFFVAVAAVVEGIRARNQEKFAETNYRLALNQAAGTADTLTHAFIEGAINSRLMAELVKHGQDTVNELPSSSDEITGARAKLLVAMSPAMTALGDTDTAREYANAALTIADGLLQRDPANFEWRRLAAESHAALGIAQFWGGAANGREQSAMAIAELRKLASIAPNDRLVLERLMPSYETLGDAARSQGDSAEAEAAYTDWLNLANKLAAGTSDQTQADFWLNYAADAHLRLGDILEQQRRYDEAAAEYQAGLDIAAHINMDEPGNTKFLEVLSLGHGKLGDSLINSNNIDRAMQEIEQNIKLSDFLVRDLAANIQWLLYQEWAHLRKGHALLVLKRYDEAYAEFAIYLRDVESMRKRDPGYVSALYDAANAHQWMGDALRLQQNTAAADSEYNESLRIASEAVQKSPAGNQAARKILAMAYYRLGLVAEAQQREADAQSDYQHCVDTKFNRDAWTPRSMIPEDVTRTCQEALARLNILHRP